MSSAGFLIYSGVMPLVKTFLTILFGYILARKGLFPPAAARGVSQVTMNMALPALLFSNIVPAFTPANVSAIGPLFLIAFIYLAIGFIMGLVIREICYVPRNFYQGILVMTGTSNWGNLPTAVVLTVTQAPPFDVKKDPALGVSFVAIFIVAYNLVFFLMGAANSLAWDYLPGVPQAEAAELRVSWKDKPIGGWLTRLFIRNTILNSSKEADLEDPQIDAMDKKMDSEPMKEMLGNDTCVFDEAPPDPDAQLDRKASHVSVNSFHSVSPSASQRPTFRAQGMQEETSTAPTDVPSQNTTSPSSYRLKFLPPSLIRMLPPLSSVLTPINVTLFVSLPIALIQRLKALFVDTTSLGGPNWRGPDGRPPLYFVIDTASSIGSICVPMALILLGASFARLSIPRPISRLALPAMISVALAKMLILPIFGVIMVKAMVKGGLIPRENKAEIFVAMFLSGSPAAVNQLIVTQLYAPDGNVDTLSAFLLVQYALMFFSSAALTAVALSIL